MQKKKNSLDLYFKIDYIRVFVRNLFTGAIGYSQGFHLGGDFHDKAWRRARDNVLSLEEKNGVSLQTDVAQWDATNIPLRQGSVDVFITDLVRKTVGLCFEIPHLPFLGWLKILFLSFPQPFGKRSGTTTDNRVLYPKILNSMAKAVRPTTGRAVLLTHDKTSMFRVWLVSLYFGHFFVACTCKRFCYFREIVTAL